MKQERIKKHEKDYFHIKKRSLGYSLLFILSLAIAIGGMFVIIDSWKFLGLNDLTCDEEICDYQLSDLMIVPLLILEYLLIGLTACLGVSIFKKLKSYDECGLIVGLIGGLIFGLRLEFD